MRVWIVCGVIACAVSGAVIAHSNEDRPPKAGSDIPVSPERVDLSNATVGPEALQQLIQKDANDRMNAALAEIKKTCEKHRVELVPKIVIQGDKIGGEIVVVPR